MCRNRSLQRGEQREPVRADTHVLGHHQHMIEEGVHCGTQTAPLCRVEAGSTRPGGNFDGLECRWQDIPSRHGETVSVMVKVLVDNAREAGRLYREVVAKMREIYGADDACHPVWPPDLSFTFSGRQLGNEVGVRSRWSGAPGAGGST